MSLSHFDGINHIYNLHLMFTGSMSLHLGTEIFDMFSMPMQDHNHLYIRQGTGLQGQAMFKSKLSFRLIILD